ncbi:fibronectin type III domain-containing protein [Streptomyces ferrugineus]|uniref:Fibronectin type III domain-containing protein n=2 Tax=Streptomyces ferrugineus TaxID=1413221 RepID=A0A7M2SKP7_9ACTN|nr:fibronectin type III domain-containing protein [Streptomyces ferrugineus]
MRLRKSMKWGATTASAVALLAAASLVTASASVAAGHEKTLTADTMATWQTDGIVWSIEYADGVVYVGGTFANVRPPGAEPGEREVARKNFAAFDAATGRLLPCAPRLSGGGNTVRALKASPSGRVLYIGGSFTRADKVRAAGAVALNTAGCSVRKDFRPRMSSYVHAIDVTNKAVYLGGGFTVVNGRDRERIAAFTPSGKLLRFKAEIEAPVRAVLAAPEHGKVLVGGDFYMVNGDLEKSLVALHPVTGKTVASYGDWVPPRSSVKALARDRTNFYAAAEGTGTGIFDGRLAGRLGTGKRVWKDTCLGATQALAVHKGVLYSGSHAHNCRDTPGGFPEIHARQHFLAQSVRDKHILHWFPDTNGGTGEGNGPRALEMAGGVLWAGGEFTKVNGRPQQSLTRFSPGPDTGTPEAVPRLKASATAGGRVKLTWRASWDRDDAKLTYLIYRDGRLVASPTGRSAEWRRPTMTYTDSVAPGSRHQYRIAVTDGTNASPRSDALVVAAVERPKDKR